MADVKFKLNGKTYLIPKLIACGKDSMIATFSEQSGEYECCDCTWTMSAKEYIAKKDIQPEIETMNEEESSI
ncbi:MAG: hypothetical protein IJY90_01790 [Clostridia bacterium]|nr:hypothetical protein [Clostridia bacterium]